ncbi:zf-HC2 domain-containing protein [Arthrobacter sp. H5]|uniref:anti-sigma factor family protein n=1 Tax=Arthrobacter sp. H5 TaxID=1267973 RepID=UPI0009DFCF0D|nr:zf-HC2 domain-containing protein [Arthrobacter sp. H5]
MRHPTRFLADFVDGELTGSRRTSVEDHLSRCGACRRAVEQEQLIRRRVRSSDIPDPAEDLCERILRRSGIGEQRSSAASWDVAHTEHQKPSGFATRHRNAMAVGGGLAVVTLATLTGAYALGSEVETGRGNGGQASSSLVAGWQSVAHDTPARLSSDQLTQLRQGGWYCPELGSMGFEVISADAITVGGSPALRLVLEDGSDSVTIYEHRKLEGANVSQAAPVNAVTGNTVTADGFERIGGMQREVWVHPGHSWQIVLDSESVTYTVVSSLPVADMPRAVNQLVLAEHSQLAQGHTVAPADPLSRILRGLSKLTQPSP